MNPLLIASLVSAAFAGAVGWGSAAHVYGAKITEMELNHANERIAIQRDARAAFERYSQTVATAQNEAASRAAILRRDADSARSELERLRNSSSAAVRASADSPAACSATVTTFDVVFTECSTRLTKVAEDADRCVNESQALIKSWPK